MSVPFSELADQVARVLRLAQEEIA
jgi:hypothetical protein